MGPAAGATLGSLLDSPGPPAVPGGAEAPMFRRTALALVIALALTVPSPGHADGAADQDTDHATPGGTTFKLPAGWTLTTKDALTILAPPETDTHLAILDIKAKDADVAV